MLQNRVDPLGNIIRTAARGSWMGNRGLLHDENQNIRRPFKLQAWLICLLEFKGRKRPVMAPRQYTELFFMDEATAFSAGHRPYRDTLKNLPDGSFILYNDKPALVAQSLIYPWSAFGYEKGVALPEDEKVPVLTPKSVVNTFRAGYVPQIAPGF